MENNVVEFENEDESYIYGYSEPEEIDGTFEQNIVTLSFDDCYDDDDDDDDDESIFPDSYYYGYYDNGCHVEGDYYDDSKEYINLFNKKLRYKNDINFCYSNVGKFYIDNFIFPKIKYDRNDDTFEEDCIYIKEDTKEDTYTFGKEDDNDDALSQQKFIWYRADLVFNIVYKFDIRLLEAISNKLNLNLNHPNYRLFNQRRDLGFTMDMYGDIYQTVRKIYTKPLNYNRWR